MTYLFSDNLEYCCKETQNLFILNRLMRNESKRRLFDPPLAIQRHRKVGEILINENTERFIDFGCGEASGIGEMLSHRAPEKWNTKTCLFTHAVGVDWDVSEACNKVNTIGKGHSGNPYIPLHVSIWEANLINDISKLKNFIRSQGITAATCCEVIEHIPQENLLRFSLNLLSLPVNTLVVTTPNKTANSHMGMLPSEKRHSDHKFEWTEQQFQEWIISSCESTPFKLQQLTGVGEIGGVHASSIAILKRTLPLSVCCFFELVFFFFFFHRFKNNNNNTTQYAIQPASPMELLDCRQPSCNGDCEYWWKWDVYRDSRNTVSEEIDCREVASGTISHSWLAYDVVSLIYSLCKINNYSYSVKSLSEHPQIKTLLRHVPILPPLKLSLTILKKFITDVQKSAPGLKLIDGIVYAEPCLWCSKTTACRLCEMNELGVDPQTDSTKRRKTVVEP